MASVEGDIRELRLHTGLVAPRFLHRPRPIRAGPHIEGRGTDAVALRDEEPVRADHDRLRAGSIGVAVPRPGEAPGLVPRGRIEADHLRLRHRHEERCPAELEETRADVADLVIAGIPAAFARHPVVGHQRHRAVAARRPPRHNDDIAEDQRRSGAAPGHREGMGGGVDAEVGDDILLPEHLAGGAIDRMEPAGGPGGIDDAVVDRRRRTWPGSPQNRLVAGGHRHLPLRFSAGQRQTGDDLLVAALLERHGVIATGGKPAPAGADRTPPQLAGRLVLFPGRGKRRGRGGERGVARGPQEAGEVVRSRLPGGRACQLRRRDRAGEERVARRLPGPATLRYEIAADALDPERGQAEGDQPQEPAGEPALQRRAVAALTDKPQHRRHQRREAENDRDDVADGTVDDAADD